VTADSTRLTQKELHPFWYVSDLLNLDNRSRCIDQKLEASGVGMDNQGETS